MGGFEKPRRQIKQDPGSTETDNPGELMDTIEEMFLPDQQPPPAQQNQLAPTDGNRQIPLTRTTKTGKVQELVVPKIPKSGDPIRGLAGQPPYNVIDEILNKPVNITAAQLLNISDTAVKLMAFSLQRCTPRYRVKKTRRLPTNEDNAIDDALITNAVAKAATTPPVITSRAHDDDGESQPVMITAWVNDLRMPKTLLDGGSMVELISRSLVKKMSPRPLIFRDGHLRVCLANDDLTTLTEYFKILVNVEGVEAMIKAWLVDVEVYDLLLGIPWMRQVRLSQSYADGKVTVRGQNSLPIEVPTKLSPIQIDLPEVELEPEEDMTADELCQQLLEDSGNGML